MKLSFCYSENKRKTHSSKEIPFMNTDNHIDGSATRKKRLSTKERKLWKKKQKLLCNVSDSNASNNVNVNDHHTNKETEDYMASYEEIPVPKEPSKEVLFQKKGGKSLADKEADHEGGSDSCRTLGKWFPDAVLVKCSVSYTNTGQLIQNGKIVEHSKSLNQDTTNRIKPKASLVLFYQYTPKDNKWTQHMVKLLMTYLTTVAKQRNIGGRIRVAQEGVNCTISAVDMLDLTNDKDNTIIMTAKETLRHVAQDLRNFDPVFNQTDFKFIDDLSPDRHFKELKIIPVQELVFYGLTEEDASCSEGGIHLDAKDYHEMLKKKNAVVIDVRNHYEAIIGRFDGQMKNGNTATATEQIGESSEPAGAEYIDPLMRKSTDFTQWLSKDETKKKLENKTVLMFCTGGIRCERASAYLKKEMGEKVEGVYQLQGGIEKYLQEFPHGGFWRGKNFVFDKREAISAENRDGDGGVIKKKDLKKIHSDKNDDLPAQCCVCSIKWDRYVGKKKCYTCGVPVLMCDKCMESKPDKTKGKELSVRCSLCVKENITVPANKVEFTQNGVKNNESDSTVSQGGKVADSVLKWGGGHASNKKLKRRMKRTICQFGVECHRQGCLFYHPDREPMTKNMED